MADTHPTPHWGFVADAASVWKPIATAPKDGAWVILGHKDYVVPEIGYFSKRLLWWSNDERSLFGRTGPTHWMPLPKPPEV